MKNSYSLGLICSGLGWILLPEGATTSATMQQLSQLWIDPHTLLGWHIRKCISLDTLPDVHGLDCSQTHNINWSCKSRVPDQNGVSQAYLRFLTRTVYLKHDIEGSWPEWCISSISTVPDQNGVSQAWYWGFPTRMVYLKHIYGSWPERCISSMILRVPDQNGVSQAWYIVEIYHSGRRPSKCRCKKLSGVVNESNERPENQTHSAHVFQAWAQGPMGTSAWHRIYQRAYA